MPITYSSMVIWLSKCTCVHLPDFIVPLRTKFVSLKILFTDLAKPLSISFLSWLQLFESVDLINLIVIILFNLQ